MFILILFKKHSFEKNTRKKVITSDFYGVCVEWFKREHILHRVDGPARIDYAQDRVTVLSELWINNGIAHRVDGPADIGYYLDGKLYLKIWYKNRFLYRENGDSVWITFKKDGSYVSEY